MGAMKRWILHDEHPLRWLGLRLDPLEDVPVGRAERLVIEKASLHVIKTAEGVEIVILVVIQRCLVTHTPEHRVRIGEDVDVVGVVVDVACRGDHFGFLRPVEQSILHPRE